MTEQEIKKCGSQNAMTEAHHRERVRRKKEQQARKMNAKNINWSRLDHRGHPAITFDPSGDQRREWIEIFDSSVRNPKRRQLLGKLSSEFSRIYARYRRMIQREKGIIPDYVVRPDERRYAERAAIGCINQRITPRQLIEYWHVHVGDFADNKMAVPPLRFIAAAVNIKTVVDKVSEIEHTKKRGWRPGDFQQHRVQSRPGQHAFSDVSQLDKRIRPGLEWEGFDLSQYSDRHLLTVQNSAQFIASGWDCFISADVKPMAEWVARNLFTKDKARAEDEDNIINRIEKAKISPKKLIAGTNGVGPGPKPETNTTAHDDHSMLARQPQEDDYRSEIDQFDNDEDRAEDED